MRHPAALLRTVLRIDAATCIAAGLLMALGAPLLGEPLGLPLTLLRVAGLSLLPFAAFLLHVARRAELSRRQVWLVIALNALWVLDSVLVLAAGWLAPTLLGHVFVLVQAAAVAVLADLELLGVRRLRAAGAEPSHDGRVAA